jgi:hypothetical protein
MLQKSVKSIADVRFYYHSALYQGLFGRLKQPDEQQRTGRQYDYTAVDQKRLRSPERTYKRKIQEAFLPFSLKGIRQRRNP